MAMRWKVIAVTPEEAQDVGTGTWEPFAVSKTDEGEEVILCKGLFEAETGKSSAASQ